MRPRIGSLQLENPLVLAPMAGVTNLPFRIMAREAGLLKRPEAVRAYLQSSPAEKPLAVQLFGSEPQVMAEAAAAVAASGAAAAIDINMGCAVRKIVRTGSGVALMRTPEKTAALLRAVRKAVRLPLTVKIRSGWDRSGAQALAIGQLAQDCGVDAVAIHPRTAAQKFGGRADWTIIAALKKRLAVPVIGNGDVFAPLDARRMMAETGCDAVMIGRAAVGCPQIFTHALIGLAGGEIPADDAALRLDLMQRYLTLSVACLGEPLAGRLMRFRLGWFARGLAHGAGLRERLGEPASIAQYRERIESFRQEWTARRAGRPGPQGLRRT
jgi:nifR3 family TIM-barrel protein